MVLWWRLCCKNRLLSVISKLHYSGVYPLNLEILQWLHSIGIVLHWQILVREAAVQDRVDVLLWIHKYIDDYTEIAQIAVERSSFSVTKWLRSIGVKIPVVGGMMATRSAVRGLI